MALSTRQETEQSLTNDQPFAAAASAPTKRKKRATWGSLPPTEPNAQKVAQAENGAI